MDKGTKNYRNMMKNMEKNMMRPDDIEQTTRDMFQSEAIKPFEDEILGPPMPMSKFDEMLRKEMMKKDPGSVVREGEMMKGRMDGMGAENIPASQDMGMDSMLDDAMSGMSMADREAIEALTTMGISLEDAIEAVMGNMRERMIEGAVNATMGGGALGALPMQRPTMRPDEFGADRTQSMDMQKEGMGT